MSKWPKIHGRRDIEPGKGFRLEEVDLEFSNGARRKFTRMKSRGLGAVIVVAMPDDDTVLLVREYAAGMDHYELGLVKGRLDDGETVLEAANRELQEEAGFGARRLEELTQLSLAPTYMTHVTSVVLARDLYPSRLEGDEPEELEVVYWSLEDLHSLTVRPDCTEGRSIAALYVARDHVSRERGEDPSRGHASRTDATAPSIEPSEP